MLFHPLCGSNPATLASVVRRNGPLPVKQWPHLGLIAATTAGRWPFSLAERGFSRWRIRNAPPMSPPVFIVGHWRSGTTHLYNLLSRSPRFGYVPPLATGIPWDFLLLGRWLTPLLARLLPSQRGIDSVPVHLDSPQEDEAALANMQHVSFYHGLYFPRHLHRNFQAGVFFDGCTEAEIHRWQQRFLYFLRKLHVYHGDRRLLIKNPVYTARIAMLRRLLPGAKFIHMHRDPVTVFQSMRNFYKRLIEDMALQDHEPADIDELILDSYPRMMHRFLADAEDLPADDLVEIRFSDLERDPLGELRRVYERLGFEGFDEDRPAFERHLQSVRNYRRNQYELPPELERRVRYRWKPFIERWGDPGAAAVPPSVESPAP